MATENKMDHGKCIRDIIKALMNTHDELERYLIMAYHYGDRDEATTETVRSAVGDNLNIIRRLEELS